MRFLISLFLPEHHPLTSDFALMQKPNHSPFCHCIFWLDHVLTRVTSAAVILVIPLALLLFAQWPLRDLFHIYSREANDLAQLLFGIYVSIGITYATRSQSHLTPDVLAKRYPSQLRAWLSRLASICIVIPWAIFIMYAATPMVLQSVSHLERFSDTLNPGYFILKIGVWLLALLVILQAIVDIFCPANSSSVEEAH